MAYERVANLDDLWEGEMMSVTVSGLPVLLVRVEGAVHAYVDRCAHKGVRLSEGRLDGSRLTCPAHLWQYDVAAGCGTNPRSARLVRLPVEVGPDGEISVDPERAR